MHSHLSQPGAVSGDFTVSVVSHGQGGLVERLIDDLVRAGSKRIAAIIVTRNLPEDPIRVPETAAFPVHFIDNPEPRGFGANHNEAFKRCASPWFVVMNPDLHLSHDPFPSMLAVADDRTALVAPMIEQPDGQPADSARVLVTPFELARRALRGAGSVGPATRPDWYAGMFLMLRSRAFAAIDGFDTRYFMYCEDVDLNARLALAGWRLQQASGARVVHDARRASHRSPQHLRWHLASLARLWSSSAFWRYRTLLRGRADARGSSSAKPARTS